MNHRRNLLALFAVAASFASVPAAAEETNSSGEIVAAVQALGEAYRDGKVDKLEELIAANYSHINNGAAPIGREAWLNFVRERAKKIKDKTLKVESYTMSDVRVTRATVDAAIVTAIVSAADTVDGKPRAYKVRTTTFWLKEDGKWKRAAFHDSPIP